MVGCREEPRKGIGVRSARTLENQRQCLPEGLSSVFGGLFRIRAFGFLNIFFTMLLKKQYHGLPNLGAEYGPYPLCSLVAQRTIL